jgi:hypothetical protein
MANQGKRPTHRLVIFHEEGNSKNTTEVGAMWEHERGYSIAIKAGLAIAGRVFAFRIDEKRDGDGNDSDYRRRQR